jgi:hypothetical protein
MRVMESKDKLAPLSGGPLNKEIQVIQNFVDELQFPANDSDMLTPELLDSNPASVLHRYRAAGSIFQLGGSELRPYTYIRTY